MAIKAYDPDYLEAIAVGYSSGDDYGYDNSHAQGGSGRNVDDEDIIDVEFGDSEASMSSSSAGSSEPTDKLVQDYIDQIKVWNGESVKNKGEFVNDANAIDNVREKRLKFARELKERPELISDPNLGKYSEYVKADLSYIARSDPSTGSYDKFMRRRAELRDKMFKGKPVLDSADYEKVVGRSQRMISDETDIDIQYELIDLRKEASLEHFDNPRFITEIYRNKRGLMDELLVDFDRKDLLAGEMVNNGSTRNRSLAMGEAFDDQVKNKGAKFTTDADKVKNFQKSREFGLNIRHNQRAITTFADRYPDGGVNFERGMAALDNVRWSESMWQEYGPALPKEDRKFILKHKGPAAAFIVARERFSDEFDRGDPKMAHSFAIMEQAASKIEKDPALQERLADIGKPDDVASFHMFTKDFKEKNLGRSTSKEVDAAVDDKMGKSGALTGLDNTGEVMRQGEVNKDYHLKMTSKTQVEVVDGAHVLVANNADDLKEGKGIVMRLDGIVAPPEGVSTKSGKIDAGLEAKANLEGVIKRHGIRNVGMSIVPSKDGEPTLNMRTADGECVSHRMLRDGYAIPTKGGAEGSFREHLTKQSESNGRGLWAEGFPEMDQSWRKEKNAPELTWRDKRLNLVRTVNQATCHTQHHVARDLSKSETKLFGLPVNKFAGSKLVDREITKVLDRNPSRIMDIYNGNMEILEDLRKRKDKLSQPEKVAHDQLSLGRRALGEALVSRNLIDAKQFNKDSHELISRTGVKISGEGVRKIADATGKVAEATAKTVMKSSQKANRGMSWLMNEVMGD
jgi:endonuclease YncB( thermonuclease family)